MKVTHLVLFLLMMQVSRAQTEQQDYYNAFDDLVGSYSTDLNTGQRFEDLYPTNSEDEFRYFKNNKFDIGIVNYNSQVYYQSNLNYDLLTDNLIFENLKTVEKYPIILDAYLVESFSVNDRKFIKLPQSASKFTFYKNGFFEVLVESNPYNLYIKHEKFVRKKIGNKSVYYSYNYKETFVLEYQFEFYQIDTKSDIISILPDKKNEIKNFYKTYKNLESQNKADFIKKLFTSLRNSN